MKQQYPGLDIDADPRQQKKEWIIQRVAWILLLALLVAVALGLFGRGGPISTQQASAGNGAFHLEYQRFMRNHSPDTLRVVALTSGNMVKVRLDSSYIKSIRLEKITPEPERAIAEEGAVTYVFLARPNARIEVAFHFSPDQIGSLAGWIEVDDHPRTAFKHFVYP